MIDTKKGSYSDLDGDVKISKQNCLAPLLRIYKKKLSDCQEKDPALYIAEKVKYEVATSWIATKWSSKVRPIITPVDKKYDEVMKTFTDIDTEKFTQEITSVINNKETTYKSTFTKAKKNDSQNGDCFLQKRR